MKQRIFRDEEGNHNLIDQGGNHFINGVCVNPLSNRFNINVPEERLGNIGDTYK